MAGRGTCWAYWPIGATLGRARTQTINRLHRLLLDLLPGGEKRFQSAHQIRAVIASVRPCDVVGRTRRRLVVGQVRDLETVDLGGHLALGQAALVSQPPDLLSEFPPAPTRREPRPTSSTIARIYG